MQCMNHNRAHFMPGVIEGSLSHIAKSMFRCKMYPKIMRYHCVEIFGRMALRQRENCIGLYPTRLKNLLPVSSIFMVESGIRFEGGKMVPDKLP